MSSDPIQLVIFGASGDLARRKLVPAMLRNIKEQALPGRVQIVGVSRRERTSADWRVDLDSSIPEALRSTWEQAQQDFHWVAADAGRPESVAALRAKLDGILALVGGESSRSGRLFYLALAPRLFEPTVAALSREGMLGSVPGGAAWRRVVVEKPFGTDLGSAQALNAALLGHLREDQLFRIDHYLGKETVQNILALRFQNAIFEPLWSRQHVESVEISVCEQVAMEGKRGAYYDGAGAIRDMVQNHLLQVLALVAMEEPGRLEAEAVRNEKVKVLKALRPMSAERVCSDVVRAQYLAGPARDRGYREEPGVDPASTTETYVAIRALIDNWRWSGVPFLLRTGKALPERYSEVVLRFRTPPVDLLNGPLPDDVCGLRPNTLRLLIQPQEGMRWSFLVKQPGPGMVMRSAELGFDYASLGDGPSPPAYQRLLADALEGNATLFIRGDEVEAAWRFVDTIRAGWAEAQPPVHTYEAGTQGPDAADGLFRGCEGTWGRGPGEP